MSHDPIAESVHSLLRDYDPEVAQHLDNERERQESTLELIASENHASPAVHARDGHLPHE